MKQYIRLDNAFAELTPAEVEKQKASRLGADTRLYTKADKEIVYWQRACNKATAVRQK